MQKTGTDLFFCGKQIRSCFPACKENSYAVVQLIKRVVNRIRFMNEADEK